MQREVPGENFTGNGLDTLTSRSPWTMASPWPRSNCIKITGSSGGVAVSRMSAATEPDLTRDDKAGVATAASDYTTTGRVRCFRAVVVVVSGLECASTTIHLFYTSGRRQPRESLHCCVRWVIRQTLSGQFKFRHLITARPLLSPLLTVLNFVHIKVKTTLSWVKWWSWTGSGIIPDTNK